MGLILKKTTINTVTSPNTEIRCELIQKSGQLFYSIYNKEEQIIKPSRLGFLIYGKSPILNNLTIEKVVNQNKTETIEMPWGETKQIENNFNEMTVHISETKDLNCIFKITFRIFDNAVAFRYELEKIGRAKRVSLKDELTEFFIEPNSTTWATPAYQPDRYEYNYEKHQARDLKGPMHTPFTIKTPKGTYLSLHEAALYDYGSMTIKKTSQDKLKTDITPLSDKSIAHVNLPFITPWRLIMIANSPIELTNNFTMYALNEPPKQDFSWVKTIKFIGIWWAMYVGEWTWAPGEKHGATTEHALEYIEYAMKLGISGLLIEGWNEGWEGNWLENGVNNSFTKSTTDFDLQKVARYANQHKIELIGHHETVGFIDNYEKQLEAAYNLYALNGIHYIKTGYAGSMMTIHGRREFHHSQLGVNHYQKTVELAARKKIMLDIHEPIKGTGIERTWPNLLSREGARGQEYEGGSIKPSHICYLLYTRLLAGGMDYTSGIFDLENPKKPIHTTLARQLAYYVVIYSGMQMAADRPHIYEGKFKKEFEFIKNIPTTFEQKIPLTGEIGEYYVVARKDRNSPDWYLGGVTNETGRRVNLDFSFLPDGKYKATFYSDSQDADYKTNQFGIIIQSKEISNTSSLELYMAPGGGFAIRLTKI